MASRRRNCDTIASAARHGVPMAGLLVPLSGLIALPAA